MAYSEQQEALRDALWGFIGALSDTSLYKGEMGKQSMVAIITEELTKLCIEDNGELNMTVAKPILRSSSWILEKRIENLKNLNVCYDKSLHGLKNDLDKYVDKF